MKNHGIDVANYIKKKLGNGADTFFWEDIWCGDKPFKILFPRMYALEVCKNVDVASKLMQSSLDFSFRRAPRDGSEQHQFAELRAKVEGVSLVNMRDRWIWSLDGSGEFTVASVRKIIDDKKLPEVSSKTRWIRAVPIKINVFA